MSGEAARGFELRIRSETEWINQLKGADVSVGRIWLQIWALLNCRSTLREKVLDPETEHPESGCAWRQRSGVTWLNRELLMNCSSSGGLPLCLAATIASTAVRTVVLCEYEDCQPER